MRLTAGPDCGKPLNSQSFMKAGQLKDPKKCSARRFRSTHRAARRCVSLISVANRNHWACRGNSGKKAPGRLAPCGIIGMANVSPPRFLLLGKLIIADKHLAVPLVRPALRRVDDLDRSNQPAFEQPSHFGMIIQGKQKPATDLVQALFELREVLVAEIVAVKLPPPVRRGPVGAGGGEVGP